MYATVQPLNGQNSKTEEFSHLFVTCPICLVRALLLFAVPAFRICSSLIFIVCADFTSQKRIAIQSLNYDNFAIQDLLLGRFQENCGTTTTDLPIRTIIYPSYGLRSTEPGVLLVSYAFANDATRFCANSHEDVAELALRDLVEIQRRIPGSCRSLLVYRSDCQRWCICALRTWAIHYLIHFAVEHTDIHHAWIVGALNSAVYTTYSIMKGAGLEKEFREVAKPFITQYNIPSQILSLCQSINKIIDVFDTIGRRFTTRYVAYVYVISYVISYVPRTVAISTVAINMHIHYNRLFAINKRVALRHVSHVTLVHYQILIDANQAWTQREHPDPNHGCNNAGSGLNTETRTMFTKMTIVSVPTSGVEQLVEHDHRVKYHTEILYRYLTRSQFSLNMQTKHSAETKNCPELMLFPGALVPTPCRLSASVGRAAPPSSYFPSLL
ncbi:hypothetical protein BC938DRAFT_483777 [Jimgerdemannia flammicorona]|uniref:Uncharacterized protein n=1 Tax=Jimgerdemannia flammicorona TaxID=994334 RepID=A0A433QBE0_9FUNG|nr:hypothetical protein BC938DRAFT_483777 [Jimgerdemannia flammicorona]